MFFYYSAVPPALRKTILQNTHDLCLSPLRHVTCAIRTDLLKSISDFPFYLSAPECSLRLLRQTALSVGDAVFLSISENKSLVPRICFILGTF